MKVIRIWLTDGSTVCLCGTLNIRVEDNVAVFWKWHRHGISWRLQRHEIAADLIERIQFGRELNS